MPPWRAVPESQRPLARTRRSATCAAGLGSASVYARTACNIPYSLFYYHYLQFIQGLIVLTQPFDLPQVSELAG